MFKHKPWILNGKRYRALEILTHQILRTDEISCIILAH
jgi:hypothetical protein